MSGWRWSEPPEERCRVCDRHCIGDTCSVLCEQIDDTAGRLRQAMAQGDLYEAQRLRAKVWNLERQRPGYPPKLMGGLAKMNGV